MCLPLEQVRALSYFAPNYKYCNDSFLVFHRGKNFEKGADYDKTWKATDDGKVASNQPRMVVSDGNGMGPTGGYISRYGPSLNSISSSHPSTIGTQIKPSSVSNFVYFVLLPHDYEQHLLHAEMSSLN